MLSFLLRTQGEKYIRRIIMSNEIMKGKAEKFLDSLKEDWNINTKEDIKSIYLELFYYDLPTTTIENMLTRLYKSLKTELENS